MNGANGWSSDEDSEERILGDESGHASARSRREARDEEGAARAEAPLAHEFLQHVHVALRIVLPCVPQVLR